MTVKNAIKKLAKYGEVHRTDNRQYWVKIGNYIVSFFPNGRDEPENSIVCEAIRRIGHESEWQTDYDAHSYFPNLTQAVNCALEYKAEATE